MDSMGRWWGADVDFCQITIKVMQTGMNVDVFEAGSVCGSAVDASGAAWFNLSKGGGCLGRFESRRG